MLSLAASVVASAHVASASDRGCSYCEEGPAVPSTLLDSCLASYGTGSIRLALTVTLPGDSAANSESGRGPPYPVILFFSGFQVCGGAGGSLDTRQPESIASQLGFFW